MNISALWIEIGLSDIIGIIYLILFNNVCTIEPPAAAVRGSRLAADIGVCIAVVALLCDGL